MVVVDASVAHKWLDAQENYVDKALQILEAHLRKQNLIIVPDIILYEVANIWSNRTSLTVKEAIDNLKQFKKYSLKIIPIDFILLRKVVDFSKKYKVTVYDASYAVLAKEKKCHLITADQKFVKIVSLPYVKYLGDY